MSKGDEFKRVRGQMLDLIAELRQQEVATVKMVEETRQELEQNNHSSVPEGTTIH